jgi:hypothetical protein
VAGPSLIRGDSRRPSTAPHNPAGSNTEVVASCPTNTSVLGAGLDTTSLDTDVSVNELNADSYAYSFEAKDSGSDDQSISAFAVCAQIAEPPERCRDGSIRRPPFSRELPAVVGTKPPDPIARRAGRLSSGTERHLGGSRRMGGLL